MRRRLFPDLSRLQRGPWWHRRDKPSREFNRLCHGSLATKEFKINGWLRRTTSRTPLDQPNLEIPILKKQELEAWRQGKLKRRRIKRRKASKMAEGLGGSLCGVARHPVRSRGRACTRLRALQSLPRGGSGMENRNTKALICTPLLLSCVISRKLPPFSKPQFCHL